METKLALKITIPQGEYPEITSPRYLRSGEREHCCDIVYSKICDTDQEKKMNTPLEEIFPEIFKPLDEDQNLLIQIGALPLVLVENASEIISKIKDTEGFIEQVIDFIITDNKSNYAFIGSVTFPYVLKEKTVTDAGGKPIAGDKRDDYGKNKKRDKLYDTQIAKLKKKLKRKKKQILHIAADLGNIGGHYGVAIRNGKNLVVFDSMQMDGWSWYSAFFSQVAYDVFNITPKILSSPKNGHCPQPTGGFIQPRSEYKSDEDYLYHLQSTESQNHFCYMWAVWYFHVFVVGGEDRVNKIFEELEKDGIDPLIVIKKYIWSIIHSFFPSETQLKLFLTEVLSDKKELTGEHIDFLIKFFLMNFRYVWNESPSGKFHLNTVIDCDLSEVRTFTDINMCLKYSISKGP